MLSVFIRPNAPVNLNTICQSRNCQKPRYTLTKRLDFSREFHRRRTFPAMKDLNLIEGSDMSRHAGISDEGFKSFDQESLVPGPLNVQAGGFESTLNNMSKWIIAATFVSVVLLRHDPESLWACIGSVINTTLSVALKKVLNQERPVSASKPDPGMPSSHAQSIFYTFVYLARSLAEIYGASGFTVTLNGLLFVVSSYFSWLRVSQQFHTVSQIVVGAVLGSIFSIFWFLAWDNIVFDLYTSTVWMRAVVILGAASFSLAFLRHVHKSWIKHER